MSEGSWLRTPPDALLRAMRSRAFLFLLLVSAGFAQEHEVRSGETGYVALQQAVRDAQTDHLALLVAAHPDDTYILLGAYLRLRFGWRVVVVLLTRGEGGQNSAGPELGEELERIRTRETEACARRFGFAMRYLNLPDRGFCRSATEALDEWGRERVVSELARAIRNVRPDIILTTHHPREPHGHDLALLSVLPEAVELAAAPDFGARDPAHRVELVYRATSPARKAQRPGEADLAAEAKPLALDVDGVDVVRGDTYRRIAYRALEEEHRTQRPIEAMETLFERELGLTPMRVFGVQRAAAWTEGMPSLFTLLSADSRRDGLQRGLEEELEKLLGVDPRLVARALSLRAELLDIVRAAAPGSALELRLQRRIEALGRVIVHGSALRAIAELPPEWKVVRGESVPLRIAVHNGGHQPVQVARAGTPGAPMPIPARASTGILIDVTPSVLDAGDGPSTPMDRVTPPLRVVLDLRIGNDPQIVPLPLEVPCVVVPSVDLIATPKRLLLANGATSASFALRIRRNTNKPMHGTLRIDSPPGWTISGARELRLAEEIVRDLAFTITPPPLQEAQDAVLTLTFAGQSTRVRVRRVAATIDPELTVGLVRGVDDTAESVLRGLGVRLRLLGDEDLALGRFENLRTILIDIRALKQRETARAVFDRLLRFAEDGGRLVVLYHKDVEFNHEIARVRAAPYPLVIGKGRVTREDARVAVLRPEHPLLTSPNLITSSDWDGWVQERGLYFAETFDPRYEGLIEMHDDGQPEELGALLFAKYGKGEYVYCALALYRQFRILHPGACRIFANLISR